MNTRPNRIILLAGLLLGTLTAAFAQERCATTQYNQALQLRNPAIKKSREALERHLQQRVEPGARTLEGGIIRIPVVVHVVHSNPSGLIGGANNSNISDEQIHSQIQVLNEDYRRIVGTSGYNDSPVGADTEIEFYLATCDPDGKPTSGITRAYSETEEYNVYDESLKKIDYWPSDKYLNIWVTNLADKYLGFAQFPDMTDLDGLAEENGTAETDGVIIDHRNFGRRTGTAISGSYRDGRTTTHEIGHWLGLLHTWGDADCGDDYCSDTPPAESSNGNKTCEEVYSICSATSTRNMIENYLDYSPDQCMNIFTQDQKNRMRKVMEVSPRRKSLLLNTCDLPQPEQLAVSFFPNPVTQGTEINVQVLFAGKQDVFLTVYDVLGKHVFAKEYLQSESQIITLRNVDLPKGMYLVRVTTSNQQTSIKRLMVLK